MAKCKSEQCLRYSTLTSKDLLTNTRRSNSYLQVPSRNESKEQSSSYLASMQARFRTWVFSDEKQFDVEQNVNVQNDRIWSRKGEVKSRVVTRRQGAASLMVWAAVTADGKSPLVFVDKGVKLNQENYRTCLLYTSPSPRDKRQSRMPSSA